MANSGSRSPNGRSTFVSKSGKPPTHLLAIIFGIPAVLILVFGVLLGVKMLGSKGQETIVTDDAKLEAEINKLLGETQALYRKAYKAVTADEANAKMLVEQAVRKAGQLSDRYSELMNKEEYRLPDGSWKSGYEWIGAKGGEVGIVKRDIFALKGF
ncbi:MAG: hypothetical protein JXP34_05255 [Planctomycetes bacterium]|nr:hypothetical protein [Planctomycetota bacterium]